MTALTYYTEGEGRVRKFEFIAVLHTLYIELSHYYGFYFLHNYDTLVHTRVSLFRQGIIAVAPHHINEASGSTNLRKH